LFTSPSQGQRVVFRSGWELDHLDAVRDSAHREKAFLDVAQAVAVGVLENLHHGVARTVPSQREARLGRFANLAKPCRAEGRFVW